MENLNHKTKSINIPKETNRDISKLLSETLNDTSRINVLSELIDTIELESHIKHAYYAFIFALKAGKTKNVFKKIDLIKKYGMHIGTSINLNSNCIESRLFRLLVEQKLPSTVKFESHIDVDTNYIHQNIQNIHDNYIKDLAIKTLKIE